MVGTSSYLLYDLETNCILSASKQQTDFDEAFSLRVDYGLSQNSEYPDIMQYKPSMKDTRNSALASIAYLDHGMDPNNLLHI